MCALTPLCTYPINNPAELQSGTASVWLERSFVPPGTSFSSFRPTPLHRARSVQRDTAHVQRRLTLRSFNVCIDRSFTEHRAPRRACRFARRLSEALRPVRYVLNFMGAHGGRRCAGSSGVSSRLALLLFLPLAPPRLVTHAALLWLEKYSSLPALQCARLTFALTARSPIVVLLGVQVWRQSLETFGPLRYV